MTDQTQPEETMEGTVHGITDVTEQAPEPPPSGPRVWMRENLFGGDTPLSIGLNGSLTVVFTLIALVFLRFITGFIFSPERRWGAVTSNMKLMMVQAFPQDELGRIWLSLGIFFVLTAWSLAAWNTSGSVSLEKVLKGVRSTALFLLLLVIIHPANPPSGSRLTLGLITLAVALATHVVLRVYGPRAKESTIPFLSLLVAAMAGIVAVIWTIDLPFPSGPFEDAPAPIARTTAGPWTILFAVTVAAYFVGRWLVRVVDPTRFRRLLVLGWIFSYPVIIMVIQRNPVLHWTEILGFGETPFLQSDLGITLLFGVIGGATVWWLSSPGVGEFARAVGSVAAIAALIVWFVPMPFVYRILVMAFAFVAVAAPTFGGTGPGQRRMAFVWLATVVLVVATFRLGASETALSFQSTTFLGGFNLTILLAITGVVLSFPLGVILALARTSTMPIFRLLATGYIELVRSVPLITWLFFGSVMLSLFLPSGVSFDEIVRVVGAVTIFSAAYVAENVRGGLQSIPNGQYEAARAMGLSTVQSTTLIILPQAIRAVIPALVGSIIVSFKDTSLVAIIGLADVLWIARTAVPSQTSPFNFLGTQPQMLFFIAIFYWVFTFTFSRLSLRYEKRVGLGER